MRRHTRTRPHVRERGIPSRVAGSRSSKTWIAQNDPPNNTFRQDRRRVPHVPLEDMANVA